MLHNTVHFIQKKSVASLCDEVCFNTNLESAYFFKAMYSSYLFMKKLHVDLVAVFKTKENAIKPIKCHSFVERVAKNNSENNGNCHKLHKFS